MHNCISTNGFQSLLLYDLKASKSDSNIDRLANFVMDLCCNYQQFSFNSPIERLNLEKDLGKLPLVNLIKEFEDAIYNDPVFNEDLKAFMILSFIYNQSKLNEKQPIRKIAQYILEPDTMLSPNLNSDSLNDLYDENQSSVLSKKLTKINALSKKANSTLPYPFLFPFCEYHNDETRIKFASLYDCELLLGLITSAVKSKNPFVNFHHNEITNFENFWKGFGHISLNPSRPCTLLTFVNDDLTEKSSIKESKLQVLNQFFLERLSCTNFMLNFDAYYDFSNYTFDDVSALLQLTNLPLLRVRLAILKHAKKHYDALFHTNKILLAHWNAYLDEFINHYLACTLPLLELVFFHCANLVTTKCSQYSSFNASIDAYCAKLIAQPSFNFFTYSDTTDASPIPCSCNSSKKNRYDACKKFSNTMYSKMITQAVKMSEEQDIVAKLLGYRLRQEESLKQHLNSTKPIAETLCRFGRFV